MKQKIIVLAVTTTIFMSSCLTASAITHVHTPKVNRTPKVNVMPKSSITPKSNASNFGAQKNVPKSYMKIAPKSSKNNITNKDISKNKNSTTTNTITKSNNSDHVWTWYPFNKNFILWYWLFDDDKQKEDEDKID